VGTAAATTLSWRRRTDRQTTGHRGRVTSPGDRKAAPTAGKVAGLAPAESGRGPGVVYRPVFAGRRRDAGDRAYQTAGAKQQITA